ncbi:uncharacterized protein LOC131069102 isoform X2 [Cryptomeria japonica]|uniref:uncharacterized protein LOC131069102 isoform X2 n=1 Tax=Cryptomeria japonica TaxID=3369 RepID=UPI0025AB65C1|nr:uncharacterized protein LOC131069102 isoform X2 [Cryptomeria japonica]
MMVWAKLRKWCSLLALALWAVAMGICQGALVINFTQTPHNPTNVRDAFFRYTVADERGRNPCEDKDINCTFTCQQVDAKRLFPCPDKFAFIKNVSANQEHTFNLNVKTSFGEHTSSSYRWSVDTISPTASVSTQENFTGAANVLVSIRFSEPCPGRGGFKCTSVRDCDLTVNGPAEVIPSSLRKIEAGLKYNILVAFSVQTLFGRVVLSLARDICTDQAGNPFMRKENSSFVIHFDKRPVYVNLWTSIPELQMNINNELRTVEATNKVDSLKVFLDFNNPIVNSTAEVLSVLHLQPNTGILTPIHRKSHGNRRFGFQITNLASVAAVTVNLQSNSLLSRAGIAVSPPVPLAFLYDMKRPQVHLSTSSPGKTKAHVITIMIDFTEPVFEFYSSGIAVHGGRIARFKELSMSSYVVNVIVAFENVVTVFIPENKATDIAGNLNLASNRLQVRHYSVPAMSIALHSFTAAGLIATSFAAGVLAISSATLAATGTLTSGIAGSIIADPSRNLLGMAGHLQVFAFSSWLSVSLPIEYHETTMGLRWLIPHAKLPWKRHETLISNFEPQFVVGIPTMSTVNPKRNLISDKFKYYHKRDHYLLDSTLQYSLFIKKLCAERHSTLECCMSFIQEHIHGQKLIWHKGGQRMFSGLQIPSLDACNYELQQSRNVMHTARGYRERKLGANSTMYGPALELREYIRYFINQSEWLSASKLLHGGKHYTGWQDFGMNMFWLGVVAGALFALHVLIVLFLKWRTKTSLRGALSFPRFELFILILTLPSMCQASAFIIRGGTTAGITIGVVLLALPAAFLLSVFLFLIVAVFMGDLSQYKEIRSENEKFGLCSKFIAVFVGRNAIGKWFRKEGLPSSFLARFGILFEDRKGPAKLIFVNEDNPKWIDSGASGIGRMRAVNSEDDIEERTPAQFQRVIGSARSAYFILDLFRRITLGIIFGAYPLSDHSWSQTSIAFGFTLVQLFYLVLLKPYIRRGVQIVESICLLCEAGVFAASLVLLADGSPSEDRKCIGIFMLVLMFVSFVSQLINEWYALMNCLVRLSPSQKPSLKLGLKMVVRGIFLPLIPQHYWSKFITPEPSQPKIGLVPVVPFSPEAEHEKRVPEISQIEPSFTVAEDVPTYHPGSPCFIDPRTVPPAISEGEVQGQDSGEIRAESSPKAGQTWSQWGRARALEGKRSKGIKFDPRTSELKMLRELAKASFPGIRKDEDSAEIAGSVELTKASPSSTPKEVMNVSTGSGLRANYSAKSSSEDDSETPSPMESPLQVPAITSLKVQTSAFGSMEKQ